MPDHQYDLFEKWTARDIAPPPNKTVEPEDRPRITGQNAAILNRLRHGPATTDELSRISRKYTSRISDIRAAGYSIDCHRREGGNNLYTLRTER